MCGASNATLRLFGCQMPPQVIEVSNATQKILGRQMPPEVIGVSNATHGLLGHQMPHWDYRGSKATRSLKEDPKWYPKENAKIKHTSTQVPSKNDY